MGSGPVIEVLALVVAVLVMTMVIFLVMLVLRGGISFARRGTVYVERRTRTTDGSFDDALALLRHAGWSQQGPASPRGDVTYVNGPVTLLISPTDRWEACVSFAGLTCRAADADAIERTLAVPFP